MGKVYESINAAQRDFISQQKLFFVGSAPSSEGHVNISPKGMDSFRVLGDNTVAYLDVTGSGAETIAHVRENGRLVIMFCAFEGRPMILRLHGQAEVIERGNDRFATLATNFPELPGTRSIIVLNVNRVADSCGWNIPLYSFEGSRDYYDNYVDKVGHEGLRKGQLEKNMQSIDGLPALTEPSF